MTDTPDPMTGVQDLHLRLIECVRRNDFDGSIVAEGLRQHRDLWVGVIAGHSYQPHPALRLFEELPEDTWSPDELWMMAINDQAARDLIALCLEHWSADEAAMFNSVEARTIIGVNLVDDEILVRAWWD